MDIVKDSIDVIKLIKVDLRNTGICDCWSIEIRDMEANDGVEDVA